MPPTVEEFARNLTQSGLMTGDEFARWKEGLPSDKRRDDSQSLALELVSSGKLTRYQAASVFQGKTEGLVLGRYVVQEKIGAGGMGQVYKAFDKRLERVVALKLVKVNALAAEAAPQLPAANGPRQVKLPAAEAVAQLFREAKTAARMQHPNIVTVHDADEAEGVFFVAMEYIDGRDLSAIVKERHPLPLEDAVDYIMQAARGLAYAHGRGVVHRDIKPANLVLDSLGTIKILDLGLARHVDDAESESDTGQGGLTQAGQVVGTVDFMSPEQAEDMRQADERSDIYSLGCTLYFLLSGKPPYSADTLIRKFLSHREWPIPSLRDLRPEAPQALDALFRRLVAKRPEDRLSSMQEFIAELSACFAPPPPPIATPELPKEVAAQGPLPRPPPLPPPVKPANAASVAPSVPHELPKLPAGFAPPRNPKPGAVWINSIGMRLNCLPAGAFLMGSPEDEKKRNDDEFLHAVRITRPFLLGAYPVTQGEFEKVMGSNPSYFSSAGAGNDKMQGLDAARFPVENVSWEEAEEFCRKLSAHEGQEYRLPTEAEWEYAARASTNTVFHFGDSLVGNEANCICRSPYGTSDKGKYLGRTTPVGSFAPNAFDLYDMHGNVWEWCHDWYDENSNRDSPPEDPAGPLYGGPWRVARGGNWRLPAACCRAAFRNAFEPDTRDSGLGFRVALSITP